MHKKPPCSGFTDPDAAEIARFGLALLKASAAIFFWVDDPIGMADVELEGLHPQFFNRYAAHMVDRDPLNVRRMAADRQRVELFRAERIGGAHHETDYSRFLIDHGIEEVVDLLFWNKDVAVAGLGLLKRKTDPPVNAGVIETAHTLQRFVEHGLRYHNRIAGKRQRRLLTCEYKLTNRESDVAELTVKGHTNAEIASLLKLGIPTVKTHLLRVLAKTGSDNRTHLAATLASNTN